MAVVKRGNRYYQEQSPAGPPPPPKRYRESSLPPPSAVAVWVAPPKELRSCKCSEVDAYGRYCIGWCGPDCEGRMP